MKYLYLTLRLFFCPHSYKLQDRRDMISNSKQIVGFLVVLKCEKCGRFKVRKFYV